MSGFAAVFHLDGAPADRAWLETMVDFLAFRGPDAREVWVAGNVGLCHALLRTRAEHDGHPKIASMDGCTWVTGDVRIDDRDTLIAKFPPEDRAPLNSASSLQLVLHAYAAWGEACVENLLGDFSFVIWDARWQRVFCARDHLGVKPLYYARVGHCLLVSNTLDCIRQIPSVSDELNEHAIGDFLIAGTNLNPATTFFSGIQKLPAANRMIACADGFRTERYWTLPIDEPVYYKRKSDYVDRFHELLHAAVRDRLPDGALGIFMSGGLDSPALAAAAVQLGASVTAFTSVYDWLIPDRERYYSGLVAQHLGIPIYYDARDDEAFGWEPNAPLIHTPEPIGFPLSLVRFRNRMGQIAAKARVFFMGDGPDAALLNEWKAHLAYLVRKRDWGRLCRDLAFYLAAHRRIPLLPSLPSMWRERRRNQQGVGHEPSLPAWINPDFARRVGLGERRPEGKKETSSPHPIRPRAFSCFVCDFPMCGIDNDASIDGATELLHPLGDLRLVQFLLAVPVVPWCRNKYLIRAALKGVLPEAVRQRPKAPLPGFPHFERARRSTRPELPPFPGLERFVDSQKLPEWPGRNLEEFDYAVRVLGLHYWLISRTL